MRVRFLTILFLLLAILDLHAVPAKKGVFTLTQPDGTTFRAVLRGDEFNHILTTEDGHAVIYGSDGWYSYARYTADGRKLSTGVRVVSTAAPSESLDIPYKALARRNAGKRSLASKLLHERRLRTTALTKAGEAQVQKAIVILAQFSDLSFKYTRDDFVNLLNGEDYTSNGATGSVKKYFQDQFGEGYEFIFDVSPIVTLSNPYSYYGENDEDDVDKRPAEMVIDACTLADPDVDFTSYDLDGDGEVDNIFVFFAGPDEAEGASDDHIWSHSWWIKDGAGTRVRLDGKLLNHYATSSELKRSVSTGKFGFAAIGTFCHEYSHVLGLEDMYDTDYEQSGGQANGLWGSTNLMDSGNYNNDGNTPPNYNALQLELLGLGICIPAHTGHYTLSPVNKSREYYMFDTDNDGECFILEARHNSGWDEYIGGSGMLIYHIDQSLNPAGYSDGQEMDLTAEERWYWNEINCNPEHECVDLVETSAYARNIAEAFWPYAKRNTFSSKTNPAFKFWSGKESELAITDITKKGEDVEFTIAGSLSISKVESFQDAAIIQWTALADEDDICHLSWKKEGSSKESSVTVQQYDAGKYAYTIEGLDPKSTYQFTIAIGDTESLSGTFTTKAMYTSGYPFIYLNSASRDAQGYFMEGSEIPLRVYNAKNYYSIKWYFDSTAIVPDGNGYYTISRPGTLKVVIDYNDGTTDIISKKIRIK